MHLYNYDTREELARNDDGGSNGNALIRHNLQAETRYLAKVRGYDSSTSGGYGFRAYFLPDLKTDGWENPISYAIVAGEDAAVASRNLDANSADMFLLLPDRSGQLIMETTGGIDTYMELYDAATRVLLFENDDGVSGTSNARIVYNVRAGGRYIAMVRGYNESITGPYGFRAYFPPGQDEYEPNDEPSLAGLIAIGTPQRHTFHHSVDVDWVKFQVTRDDRYTIRTRGVHSNSLDTRIELFDANFNTIAGDDDGGVGLDSRLSLRLQTGLYHLKVSCLVSEPDQPYTISIEAE